MSLISSPLTLLSLPTTTTPYPHLTGHTPHRLAILTPVRNSITELHSSEAKLGADVTNLQFSLAKIAKVTNSNNAKNKSRNDEFNLNLIKLKALHKQLQTHVVSSVTGLAEAQHQLSNDFIVLQSNLDASFELTLQKIDTFFEDSAAREVKLEAYAANSMQKEIQADRVVNEFQHVKQNFMALQDEVDSFTSIRTIANRLLFRLNKLGFEDMESLNLCRKITWTPSLDPLRVLLQLGNHLNSQSACLPAYHKVVGEKKRITSPSTTLLIPGGAQYVFTFEIGEDSGFPGYLGIYLSVHGREYPICLDGTELSIGDSVLIYGENDIVTAETKMLFKVLMPYAEAADMFFPNGAEKGTPCVMEAELRARLLEAPKTHISPMQPIVA